MKGKLPPHLVERDGTKCCSACGLTFADDAQPSLSKAFVNHVRQAHKPEPKETLATEKKSKSK